MTFRTIFLLAMLLSPFSQASEIIPEVQLPSRISGDNVLILYKEFDAFSKEIADYYAEQRHIPASHIVPVTISGSPAHISREKFGAIYQQISPHLTAKIKVIVLTWHAPYRVDCMSITSAFSLGFDPKYCSQPTKEITGCHQTANSAYFNQSSYLLWQQNSNIRLTMMLSGKTLIHAKELIDRGVASDNTHPEGTAYLVRTHDAARSTRWPIFKQFADIWGDNKGINVKYIDDRASKETTQIKNKQNIMFYHTGLAHVPAINSNHYLPGAIADHLTSTAGRGIEHPGQMKAFRWLEAGVTASYGAVIEPCNFTEKFPNPQILIPAYVEGDSLIEAYWKSVQQPGEGLFIGEPLARPWSKTQISFNNKTLLISSQELDPDKSYRVESQPNESASWQRIKAKFNWNKEEVEIQIPQATAKRYRILEEVTP